MTGNKNYAEVGWRPTPLTTERFLVALQWAHQYIWLILYPKHHVTTILPWKYKQTWKKKSANSLGWCAIRGFGGISCVFKDCQIISISYKSQSSKQWFLPKPCCFNIWFLEYCDNYIVIKIQLIDKKKIQ